MEDLAAARGWPWQVELVADPDALLIDAALQPTEQSPSEPNVVVATADSAILDRCRSWFSLAREAICRHVPTARLVGLGGESRT